MAQGLNIQVGADVQEAITGIGKLEDKVDSSFGSIADKVNGSGKSFDNFGEKIKDAGTSARKATRDINIFEGSIEDLNARIGARKSFLNTETDVNKIRQLNKEISYLEFQAQHLANTGKVSFDQFGRAIDKTAKSTQVANVQISAASFSLSNLGSSGQKALAGLYRIAAILPGLGVSTLVSGIFQVGAALVGLGSSAKQAIPDFTTLTDKIKDTKEKTDAYNAAIAAASATLLSHARDLREVREALTSTAEGFDGLSKSIVNQAVTQFLFDKKNVEVQKLLEALVKKRLELLKQSNPFADIKELTDAGTKTIAVVNRLKKAGGNVEIPVALQNLANIDKDINDTGQNIEILNRQARLLGVTFNDLIKPETVKKVKDGTNDIINHAKRLLAEFADPKKPIFLSVLPTFSELDTKGEQLVKAKRIISDIKRFFTDFGALKINIPTTIDLTAPEEFKPVATEFGTMFYTELQDYFKNNAPTDFTLLDALKPKILTEAEKLGQDIAAAINEGIKNIAATGLTSIGETIGTALSGGDIGDAFRAFAGSLGDAISALGKQIIGIGVAALLAKEALKSLFANPGLALLAGTALVAAGAALKGALSGGVKAFASGGLVFGPTLGLVGEGAGTNRNNPEVIAPLDQLRGLLSDVGNGGRTVLSSRIRGNDLLLVQARTSRSQGRAGAR